jgi:hypothetical protein
MVDIPEKDVVFTRGMQHIVRKRTGENLYQERDPVKIVSKRGEPSLLVERENSLIKILSDRVNFVPSVYANAEAFELLRGRGAFEARTQTQKSSSSRATHKKRSR